MLVKKIGLIAVSRGGGGQMLSRLLLQNRKNKEAKTAIKPIK
jgi:hypothetical protein